MPNTPVPAAAAGLPANQRPTAGRRLSQADEFLHLTEQRRQIDRRLDELSQVLGPVFGVFPVFGTPIGKRVCSVLSRPTATLPKSGLRIVASTARGLTCKGGARV